jgi:hypothetical protein
MNKRVIDNSRDIGIAHHFYGAASGFEAGLFQCPDPVKHGTQHSALFHDLSLQAKRRNPLLPGTGTANQVLSDRSQ